ncbi:hypothetical protein [Wenyingzhuangia marina]|uniref:hypothetical protein n=1 Tax=Wenyingzhuangia marina TaxID=1195760 RepID=UPI0009330063|nr:hypothetical protein [Wenyingzhuangia marina]GGF73707.1 hypothetical protein GCM10011397_15790 [Wenyingzhuangia marina]
MNIKNQGSGDYIYNREYAKILYELNRVEKAKEVELDEKNKRINEIPVSVKEWIDSELAKNTKKPLTSLDTSDFFNDSSARVVGYIKGYNGNQALDFTTGMFYPVNIFESNYFSTIVNIYPDGRFEANLPLSHPVFSKIFINNKWIPFYLEPEQTLAMVIDSEGLYSKKPRKNRFKNTLFLGNLAQVNYDLINYNFEDFNYNNNDKKTQEFSYDAYKKYRQQQLQYNLENYHTYVSKRQISSKAAKILKNTILVDNAVYLFNFLQHHPTDVLLEPLNKIYKPNAKDDFYTFLNTIPWNDQSLLLTDQFSSFINRFEYLDRLEISLVKTFSSDDEYLAQLTKKWQKKDSITKKTFNIDISGFINNTAKIRDVKNTINSGFVKNEQKGIEYWNSIKTTLNTVLNKKALQIINQYYTQKEQGVEIPNTKAGAILKKIIAPYKGKTIFLKIWANNGIHMFESQLKNTINPINKKYKNEVAFVYLTEENKYLTDWYVVFVKEHNLTNSYRISEDEMNQLRQLFKSANRNFTVFINKEEKIMDNDFQLNNYNIQTELEKTTAKK